MMQLRFNQSFKASIVLATIPASLQCLATALVSLARPPTDEISLTLGPHRDMTIEKLADNALSITLQPGHPHFWTEIVPKAYNPDVHSVLAIEYFAPSGLHGVVLRYRVADGTMAVAGSAQAGVAETWQPMVFDLSRLVVPPANLHPETRFHFVLSGIDGTKVQLRNIRLRVPNSQEQRVAAEGDKIRLQRQIEADAIVDDLRSSYSSSIDSAKIGLQTITVTGKIGKATRLVGIASHHRSYDASRDDFGCVTDSESKPIFRVEVPRFDGSVDLATWRWRLLDDNSNWRSLA